MDEQSGETEEEKVMGWVMDTSNRDVDYDNIELLFTF